jgi:2-oxoglutarate dehydrogenase E2 component (dihydrolipoamide succinyltransferase)
VRDADQMSLAEIEKEDRPPRQARPRRQAGHGDLQGGTFTISNGGVYGSLMSTPILNPPQSGMLGMHKIQERPVVVDGQIVIRPMMYLALSYDHRIVDGKEAVTFLVRVKEALEDPSVCCSGLAIAHSTPTYLDLGPTWTPPTRNGGAADVSPASTARSPADA